MLALVGIVDPLYFGIYKFDGEWHRLESALHSLLPTWMKSHLRSLHVQSARISEDSERTREFKPWVFLLS